MCKLRQVARSSGMAIFGVCLTGLFLRNAQRLLQLTVVLGLGLALAIPSSAQSAANAPLTNADIVKMVKAGVPESVILRKVQMSQSDFATSPDALIELKRQHVPNEVMAAMLDSQVAMGMPPAEPDAPPSAVLRSADGRSHHLPTFDAKLRVGSKTTEKVSVSKNQIKVEQGGTPIFTLHWTVQQPK